MVDEARLVQQAAHDPQAFGLLYDRYVERIYAYAQREMGSTALAQDVVSATFEKAWKHLPGYEWRGHGFGAWLYRIARNEMLMYWRRQKWTVPLLGRLLGPSSVEQTVQAREQQDELRQAMGRLPARDQEILRLSYYEELSHNEIGEVLDCSSGNVAVRLHRALKRLKKELERESREVMFDVTS
jgi:RNA polymerase sigma-70 factor (ECF subfamily)